MTGGRPLHLRRAVSVPVEAVVFAAAGLCTCATLLVVVLPAIATTASLAAGVLTLAGLLILGFGASDERPLRAVPAAQALLLLAAVAGVVQTTALQVQVPAAVSATLVRLVVPGTGLLGGVAVGTAAVLLAVHRTRHGVRAVVFLGLGLIAVSALVTNGTALLADRVLLSAGSGVDPSAMLIHLSVLGSGVGQLVIAMGLVRRTRTAVQPSPRGGQQPEASRG